MNKSQKPRLFSKRKTIRLKGYDYSQYGSYFVTICIFTKEPLLGDIYNDLIILSRIGHAITKWWQELPRKFPHIKLDEFVIMPNHIHGIITIVGADLCVGPNDMGAHTGAPLQKIVQWLKTMTTNEYLKLIKAGISQNMNSKLWQRGYFEHVIRNEKDLSAVRQYINDNPLKWQFDSENPNMISSKSRSGSE